MGRMQNWKQLQMGSVVAFAWSIAVVCGCRPDGEPDVGDSATDGCLAEGNPSLTIGQGSGSEFNALADGDEVGLDVAPQGGFGVSVRAKSAGLVADDVVDVLLVTEIAGEQVGSFLNEGTMLYCQDDGAGLLWGVVVGFDPDVYTTNEDLLELDGQEVSLGVTAYDVAGNEAEGWVDVVIRVGQ